MTQPQNIFKLFLLAVFCLIVFVMAEEVRAFDTSLNPTTKMLEIRNDDGSINRTVFPVSMNSMCNAFLAKPAFSNCDANLKANSEYDMELGPETYGDYNKYIPIYEQNHVGYMPKSGSIPPVSVRNNPYIYFTQNTPCGTDEPDYTTPLCVSDGKSRYSGSKSIYPKKLVYMNNYRQVFEWLGGSADILGLDAYANVKDYGYSKKDGWCGDFNPCFVRADMLYGQEVLIGNANGLAGKTWSDSRLNNKAIWLVINALSQTDGLTNNPMTKTEVKGLAWTGIASGVQGITYWGYLPYSGNTLTISGTNGIANDATIRQYYADISSEIKSLNDILILPTKSIFWRNDKNTTFAEVTPNPTKNVYSTNMHQFTYLLKQPSVTNSFLIVVNKDINPTTGTQMWVKAFASGTQTVKKLISGSGSWQTMTATAGKWSDNFASYAVHVYQICATGDSCVVPSPPPPSAPDTTLPAISITCPGTGNTYSSPTISLSGTASDNIGVSKVEVKVGPAGAYQLATGTTSWSISGVTLVAGLNTVYARATDAAGNSKEVFIQVTYDSTAPPPPTVSCTKFVAKTGNDSNPGSEASPWLTIQKAADVAVAGDTVCVKAGTYNERVIVKNSGTPGNWISFVVYPGHTVTIDGTGINIASFHEGLIYVFQKSYIKIYGFKVVKSDSAGIMVSGIGTMTPWSHVAIEKNYIYDTASSARFLSSQFVVYIKIFNIYLI